jgi:hypothetical protein
MKRKPSPATLLASVALFFSLGGAGMAATGFRITSLSQIRPSVRHALKGRAGIRGLQGVPGAQGVPGIQGPQGPDGNVDFTKAYLISGGTPGSDQVLTTGDPDTRLIQRCHPGDRVITGGFDGSHEIVTTSQIIAAFPDEYEVEAHRDPNTPTNPNGLPGTGIVEAWALCAPAH